MRVLVTGADGFIGSHLLERFVASGVEAWGTWYYPTVDARDLEPFKARLRRCDVRYSEQVRRLLREIQPSVIFHMAAQSLPALSWQIPIETLETNIIGTANLFEELKSLSLDPVVIVACSSAEYGFTLEKAPIKESHPLLPVHPYGVSKVAVDLLTYQYWANNKMRGIRARIFNTTGPRKLNDACADFTSRMASIETGESPPVLRVGNLHTRRAFLDVRDTVEALTLLADKGRPGEAYNISGAVAHEIQDVLALVLRLGKRRDVKVEQDPGLLRTSDELVIHGNVGRLIDETGWRQRMPLEDTIRDMLEYWRRKRSGATEDTS